MIYLAQLIFLAALLTLLYQALAAISRHHVDHELRAARRRRQAARNLRRSALPVPLPYALIDHETGTITRFRRIGVRR